MKQVFRLLGFLLLTGIAPVGWSSALSLDEIWQTRPSSEVTYPNPSPKPASQWVNATGTTMKLWRTSTPSRQLPHAWWRWGLMPPAMAVVHW